MLIAICCEALRMNPEEVLDSDYVLLLSVLRERNFFMNTQHKSSKDEDNLNSKDDWVYSIDYATGQRKKVKKVKTI